jgi:hypothetical protein
MNGKPFRKIYMRTDFFMDFFFLTSTFRDYKDFTLAPEMYY